MAALTGDLVGLYLDDEDCQVQFVGGPGDGDGMIFRGSRPPAMVVLPVNPGPLRIADLEGPPLPQLLLHAGYEPVLDALGFYSRGDDGAYRYRYCGER